MSFLIRIFVAGVICFGVLGCDNTPVKDKLDPAETKAKEEEINKGMEEAMKQQMQGGGQGQAN